MTFTAKQFQSILDIVHQWYLQGFRDLLVNGQLALPYDFQRGARDAMMYVVKYCAKPDVMYCRARQEEQCRRIFPLLHTYAITTNEITCVAQCCNRHHV